MTSILEKGGETFEGIKLLLRENPLPPIDSAVAAAQAEVPCSNHNTEPNFEPLRRIIADSLGVPHWLVHINAGSELILRQLFDRLGQQVHLLTPTQPLFPEIAERYTGTRLLPEKDFAYDLEQREIPAGTTLAVIVDPNNPNSGSFAMNPLSGLLRRWVSNFASIRRARRWVTRHAAASPASNLPPRHYRLRRTVSRVGCA